MSNIVGKFSNHPLDGPITSIFTTPSSTANPSKVVHCDGFSIIHKKKLRYSI